MKELKVRKIPEDVYYALVSEAKGKKIGTETLVRNILRTHVIIAEVKNIDDKYQTFAQDILSLYKDKLEELEEIIQENNVLMEQLSTYLGKEK